MLQLLGCDGKAVCYAGERSIERCDFCFVDAFSNGRIEVRVDADREDHQREQIEAVTALAERFPQDRELTVVTNSPPILNRLAQESGLTLMSTGGEFQRDLNYLCGIWTRDILSKTRLDKAFLGVSAIDAAYGISTTRPAHAEIKKVLATAARTRIGLADHTKFVKQNFTYVGPITDLDVVVTSSLTPEEHIEALRATGIKVVVAPVAKT